MQGKPDDNTLDHSSTIVVDERETVDVVSGSSSETTDRPDPTPEPPRRKKKVSIRLQLPTRGFTERMARWDRVARGGMASILSATDTNLQRTVAVKKVDRRQQDQPRELHRLIGEAQIIAQLDHPNIVPVYELGTDEEGVVYYTMKLIRGRNLGQLLGQQDCRFRTSSELYQLLQIFIKVCDAVGFAHSRGVIHRDLKPENVMVGEYGEVYLMDWGIARLARGSVVRQPGSEPLYGEEEEGRVVGSPGFMSPEQAMGKISSVDERSDIFSLGAILYNVLTGKMCFTGRTVYEALEATIRQSVKPPLEVVDFELPNELCRIVMRALRREPDQRYQTVAELKQEVDAFMQDGWQFLSRVYPPGVLIIREGDEGDEAYVITEGECEVFKGWDAQEELLARVGPGEVFGETAIITDSPRTASVRAVGRVTVLVVSRDQLQEAMGTGFFMGRLTKVLAQRFRDRNSEASALSWQAREAEVSMAILSYLNFSGTTVGKNLRIGCWSELRKRLLATLDYSELQLDDMLGRLEMFSINAGEDVISLRNMDGLE